MFYSTCIKSTTSPIMVKFMFACIWYHWHQTTIFQSRKKPSRKSLSLICWWQFRQDWACIIRLSDVRNYRISHETFWVSSLVPTINTPRPEKSNDDPWMAWRNFGFDFFFSVPFTKRFNPFLAPFKESQYAPWPLGFEMNLMQIQIRGHHHVYNLFREWPHICSLFSLMIDDLPESENVV